MTFTKDMGIIDVVNKHPLAMDIFRAYGLGCVGCMAAQFETLEEGCMAHGIDVDLLVQDLNDNMIYQ